MPEQSKGYHQQDHFRTMEEIKNFPCKTEAKGIINFNDSMHTRKLFQ